MELKCTLQKTVNYKSKFGHLTCDVNFRDFKKSYKIKRWKF